MRARPVRDLVRALVAAGMALIASSAIAQSANPPPPREHAAVLDQMGGLYDGPIAPYVVQVGGKVAAAAGQPTLRQINGLAAAVLPAQAQARSGVVDVTVPPTTPDRAAPTRSSPRPRPARRGEAVVGELVSGETWHPQKFLSPFVLAASPLARGPARRNSGT